MSKKKTPKAFGSPIAIALIGAGIFLWDPLPPVPHPDTLRPAPGQYDVEINRDEYGVPHIIGATKADVAFGLGFAHSEDDFATFQLTAAAARGTLARYQGKSAVPADFMSYFMDVGTRSQRDYPGAVTDETYKIASAYAAGVNLYVAENPNAVWAGMAPFTAEDVIAGFIYKTPFFYGFDGVIGELASGERNVALALDPASADEAALSLTPKPGYERGSNAFAVSPERSGDGVTRLFINSHQPLTGPVAWYEAHLISDDGWNVQGGLFPGTPVVLCGFTTEMGWANTVSAPDLVDVYKLTVKGDQYKLDDEWVDFDYRKAKLRIKIAGPFALKVNRKILVSVHGPVIENDDGFFAVSYAGMDTANQLDQYVALNSITDYDSFDAAMSIHALPSINYVFANADGDIGLIHNGQYPVRKAGWDYSLDLPGDRSDLVWGGVLPYAYVPKLLNPESGFVYNANNRPDSATDGPDNLTDLDPLLGLQTDETNRSLRVQEMTDGTQPISRERLLEIKFDNAYAKSYTADEVVQAVLAEDFSDDVDLYKAQQILAQWDYRTDADSKYAALGALTVRPAVTAKYTGTEPPSPRQAFISAVEFLNTHHDGIETPWGNVNRIVRGDVSFPLSGASTTLRAVYGIETDGEIHMSAGDSYMALIEWDAEGQVSADVVHHFGSHIADAENPHYNDQVELFANEQFRKALITREEVKAAAKESYKPGEREE